MKTTKIVLITAFALLCNLIYAENGTDTLSLNGYWKFNTLFGEGSNYLDIKPEANDIVIDNRQTELLETKGNWQVSTNAERESSCWKEDYLRRYFNNGDSAYIRFKTKVPQSGYYEQFIYYPFGIHLTAQINIKHAEGIATRYISERNRTNQWISLGIFKLNKGENNFIEVTAVTPGQVVADAVMLRPVKEEDVLKAQTEKKQVYRQDYNDSQWYNLKVPGHWGMINKFSNYTGKGWYRKEFTLPENWRPKPDERIRIKFDGVYHVARVFLNGKFIGQHRGGFTPFEFDITKDLKFGQKNMLAVEADNNYLVGATWNWGGIIRDVYLLKNKIVRISYQYIRAEPDLETGTAAVTLNVRVENNSSKKRNLQIHADLANNKHVGTLNGNIQVEANSIIETEMTTSLEAKDVKLWSFDSPNLYRLNTFIRENGQILDKRSDNFGIRQFKVTNSQMLLNGEPVRLAGFNRVSDHRYWGDSEPQELIDLDMKLMKNAGANFMRIMHGTQNKKLIDACDKEGIMIFEEVNVRELTNPEFTAPNYPLVKQWLTKMIERDVNHPAIVGWSIGNELSDHYNYVKTIIPWVKKNLDPSRLVACVSNTGYKKNDNRENDPLKYSDIILQNIYQKNHGKVVMDVIRKRWPEKAQFISEFGVQRFTTPDLDNDLPGLNTWNNEMRGKRTYVTGASMWTYDDYRSGYSQTLPSENRAWGIVNAWRQKRRSYQTVQKENSPVKDIVVENLDLNNRQARVSIPIRASNDDPCYTMRNYRLAFVFYDKNGNTELETFQKLPDLHPDDAPWEGTVEWASMPHQPFSLEIKLLTPKGYTRYVKTISFEVPTQPIIRQVIQADGAVRVTFDKQFGAHEYYAAYNETQKTAKTIGNYIDINKLENGKTYRIQLIACNDKGESTASPTVEAIPEKKQLPPIIWKGMIRDNKLIVGYSGEKEDEKYTVEYGSYPDKLDKKLSTNVRGMLTTELDGEKTVFFRLKRTTENGESSWSETEKANSDILTTAN